MTRYRTLEEVLVGEGYLAPETLAPVLAQRDGRSGSLGVSLVEAGLLPEAALTQALSVLYELPVVDVASTPIEPGLLEAFPLDRMRQELFLPLHREGARLVVAVADPGNVRLREDLPHWHAGPVSWVLAPRSALQARLSRVDAAQRALQALSADFTGGPGEPAAAGGARPAAPEVEHPTIRLVDTILQTALAARASDVHLEATEQHLLVKFRVDGMLRPALAPLDRRHQATLVSRIKIMAELDIAEHRIPQDGRFTLPVPGRAHPIDCRVSILPSAFGEAVVIRLLDKEAITAELAELRLDRLGLGAALLRRLRRHITRPHGLLLVTGPTGSGKTTTLYAALSEIHTGRDKIITIEDPIEYQLHEVVQIPVNEKKGLTFARGLRSILRHDPDKILVGEIRDPETAQIAIQSALTGHLVFTTVHANNVLDVLGRFLNMGLEPYHFLSALNCILTQRLVRVLCPACRQPVQYAQAVLQEAGVAPDPNGPATCFEAGGCEACQGTGFRGRTAVAELVEVTDPLRSLILERRAAREIYAAAQAGGTVLLRAAALEKWRQGLTTLEEVNRVTYAE